MRRFLPLLALFLVACASTQQAAGPAINLTWSFPAAATSTDETPMSRAVLLLAGETQQTIDLGTYAGQGMEIATTSWTPPEGAVTAAIFWWAGGGDEVSVFRTAPGTLTVRHRTIDEVAGYGEFEDMTTISVPDSATVTVTR